MSTLTTRSGKGTPLTNNEVDTNFTNLNSDKYQSGDNAALANLTVTGTLTLGVDASVSAAGTTQGEATALTKTFNIVNTATTNQGVQLPDCAAGVRTIVYNSTTAIIKIYPASGESINDESANTAIDLDPDKGREFIGISATQWQSTDDQNDAGDFSTIDASGLASLDGGIDVDGNFTVADGTGNVTTQGSLEVSGLSSLDGGIDVDSAFTVADTSGNVSTSGTLDVTGTTTLSGSLRHGMSATVTAAGSDLPGATALTETMNVVTGGAAGTGVALPTAIEGLTITVFNTTSADQVLYANSGDTVEGGASISLPASTTVTVVASDNTEYKKVRPLAVFDNSGTLLN